MPKSPAVPLVPALGLLALLTAMPARAAAERAASDSETWRTGEIVPRVACKANPGESYALYLPAGYVAARPAPILYLFDAQQRGPLAAERFRAAAESLGFILASSNDSRSDGPRQPTIDSMKAMWADTHTRFAIDAKRVYAAGYSGGARAATLLALARPGEVAGVVGCGGGFPFDRPPTAAIPFAFFGGAGLRDFNYSELRKLDLTLAALGKPHRFEVFDGGHAWCPVDVAGQALRWMNLLAMRDGAMPRAQEFIEAEWREQTLAAESLAAAGDPVRAARRYDDIAHDFAGLRDVASAVVAGRRIAATPAHEAAAAAEESAEREAAEYLPEVARTLHDALAQPASVRLPELLKQLRVPGLERRATDGAGTYTGQAARRLLEVLYVQTSYDLPTELERRKDYARATLSLRVATAVEPEQPAGWFNLACALAPEGDTRGALAALARAVALGFDDAVALAGEPALERLRGEQQFRELLARLRRRAAG